MHCFSDCSKRVTWSANIEKHCEESGHSADVDSEARFIHDFFERYATLVAPAPTRTDQPASNDNAETVPVVADQTNVSRKVKRKGKEKEFKLDDVPWNLRPHVDEDLHEYITSRKVSFFGSCSYPRRNAKNNRYNAMHRLGSDGVKLVTCSEKGHPLSSAQVLVFANFFSFKMKYKKPF